MEEEMSQILIYQKKKKVNLNILFNDNDNISRSEQKKSEITKHFLYSD